MLLFQKIFRKRNYIYKLMAFKRKEFHKEENCLNCGYPLVGKYCGNCGQKAYLHKDSFFHMVIHFVADYFHYDNKFWLTIKALFTKPGVATLEYNEGKRGRYLNPIPLYIFVTTIFFLVVFSFDVDRESNVNEKSVLKQTDSISTIDTSNHISVDLGSWRPIYKTKEAYDSAQLALPAGQRDHFFRTYVTRKVLRIENETTDATNERALLFLKKNFSKVFFVLLPLFAFFLKILYLKRKIYYIDHLIFSIHFHIVCFLLILVYILIASLVSIKGFDDYFALVFVIGIGIYLFLALRKVHHSSVAVTLLKQFVLLFLYLVSFCLVMIVLFVAAFFF